jgi:hypothetical protein
LVGYGDNASLQIEGTSYPQAALASVLNSNNVNGPSVNLAKTRGTSNGSNTVVQDDDVLGVITFSGADGTDTSTIGARIQANVDGAPGANVMPSRLVFSTNGGGASPTNRIEIGSNGALKLLAGCPGIDFSASQTNASGMTSETLDSYEEGTFVPAYSSAGSSHQGTFTDSGTNATYTKIGRVVHVRFSILSSTQFSFNANTRYIRFDGLPFNAVEIGTGAATNGSIAAQGPHGVVFLTTQNIFYIFDMNVTSNFGSLTGTFTYMTDA